MEERVILRDATQKIIGAMQKTKQIPEVSRGFIEHVARRIKKPISTGALLELIQNGLDELDDAKHSRVSRELVKNRKEIRKNVMDFADAVDALDKSEAAFAVDFREKLGKKYSKAEVPVKVIYTGELAKSNA